MKKILFQLFIGILIISCSSSKSTNDQSLEKDGKEIITHHFTGKIDKNQLDFIKNNYNWKTARILIINYIQPRSSCHFNNHTITNESKWWNKFYSNIDTENCKNIHIMSNGEKNSKNIDNKNIFDDKYDFLLTMFFKRRTSCFGVLVINSEGDYFQFNGHYSEKQVSKYIENLR